MLEHFLDIYSKFVIAVISFIAPLTSYLLSTYLTDRIQILKRLEEQKTQIDKILKEDLKTNDKKGLGPREIIKLATAKLKANDKEINKNLGLLNFLNPKRRIGWLFSILFFSMITLLSDSLVRGNVFNMYNHKLSVFLLILSCLSFGIALFSLGRIAWKLIDAKEIIVKENKALREAEQPENIQQDLNSEVDTEQPLKLE